MIAERLYGTCGRAAAAEDVVHDDRSSVGADRWAFDQLPQPVALPLRPYETAAKLHPLPLGDQQ